MAVEHAIISGAGVAGLSAALSLAQAGIRCDIYEKAPQLTEVGAGLQIAPNASRILSTLGVLADLEAVWNEPERIDLLSGSHLKRLASVPVGAYARKRWGAPYGVLHRATLQQALLAAVLREPLCRLNLGVTVDPVAETLPGGRRPDLVVGADGVWSRMRAVVPSCPIPAFSGNIAWRFTVPGADAPSFLDLSAVSAFLGPDAHVVAYPLAEIGGFNIVAITAGNSPGETWNATSGDNVRLDLLMRRFEGWHADIRKMLEAAREPRFWPLYQASDGNWHNGVDTVLIGDAAHAMMPFAAQGAAMAIEDAFELAQAVSGALPVAEALKAFEAKRKPRIARARERAAFNRFAYHAKGPVRIARDLVLSMRSPQSLGESFDWLYGYRAA